MIKINYTKLTPEQVNFCLNHAEQIRHSYERVNGKRTAFILIPIELYEQMEKL